MSSLTREVKNTKSPVAVWLRTQFPHHREIQTAYRIAAGSCRVMPSRSVALGTQGAAIDWWLRFLVDPEVSLRLPLVVLKMHRPPGTEAGLALLDELGVATENAAAQAGRPDRHQDRPDEWWARVCYALALFVEIYRNRMWENTRLTSLGPGSTVDDLLALANDDEVIDLIAMRDLAREHLLPALPKVGPVISGMTFDGSKDLNADGDLIVGGLLVDFKAAQGRPRADGTRASALAREDLDQLLGYVLLDYSNHYDLHSVAIYAARYGYLAAWPLDELCARLGGHPVDVAALRSNFANLLATNRSAFI
jgi:hypothetical protein